MPTLTGKYTQASGPFSASEAAEVEAVPNRSAMTRTGKAISAEPRRATCGTDGSWSLTLEPSTDIVGGNFWYTLRGRHLKPAGYGGSGYSVVEVFADRLVMPARNVTLAELLGAVI